LTRTDIADHLGLTIETVSRQITRLRGMNLIKLKGARRIVVPDLSALESIAEVDQT
jgi:CRP/FNR family transcriptional regulator